MGKLWKRKKKSKPVDKKPLKEVYVYRWDNQRIRY